VPLLVYGLGSFGRKRSVAQGVEGEWTAADGGTVSGGPLGREWVDH